MLTVVALEVQEGCDCMTVEEKSTAIEKWCDKFEGLCSSCPIMLANPEVSTCYSILNEKSREVVEQNYEILFGSKPDNVNHPAHYETGKFECIDVMVETQGKEAVKAYCLCAAFKYLYRHNRKNGLEDIKKARWYLDKYVELEEGEVDDKA